VVYADGVDARLMRRLISRLGSEERVQNALILTGFISKLEKKSGAANIARAKRVRQNFEELVGVSFQEFQRLTETN
jgi:hypothetical protein